MRSSVLVCVAVIGLAGCTGPNAGGGSAATYEVRQSDSMLEITGADTPTRLVLQTGMFTMSLDDVRDVDGRRLHVEVDGVGFDHESEGYQHLALPIPDEASPALVAFLDAPQVSSALDAWGIGFAARTHTTVMHGAPVIEQPFVGGGSPPPSTCHYGQSGSCVSTSCVGTAGIYIRNDTTCSTIEHELVCCSGSRNAIDRQCGFGATGNPCGTEGPLGCAVCWSHAYTSSCTTGQTPQDSSALLCPFDGSTVYPDDLYMSYN